MAASLTVLAYLTGVTRRHVGCRKDGFISSNLRSDFISCCGITVTAGISVLLVSGRGTEVSTATLVYSVFGKKLPFSLVSEIFIEIGAVTGCRVFLDTPKIQVLMSDVCWCIL